MTWAWIGFPRFHFGIITLQDIGSCAQNSGFRGIYADPSAWVAGLFVPAEAE